MSIFHDRIAKLCLDHFKSLPKTGKPNKGEWTILSCIVQECNDLFKVIALGTGTKCVGVDKMSNSGDVLNDSHAEIVCRRTFLRYLYENMQSCREKDKLFEFNSNKKFKMKTGIKFHFFTTHVPCGDAAIFPKQDYEDFGNSLNFEETDEPQSKKVKLKCDIFRTGAKCLETDTSQDLRLAGSEYHKTGLVRTKPGRGVKTLSVSCSDKIAKWCHLGVQGALLSILVDEPIYFSSFTISETPFCPEALNRALFTRFGSEFKNNNSLMVIGQSKIKFDLCKSGDKNPCPSSISWLALDTNSKQVEVAVEGRRQGLTKKRLKIDGGRLKISKRQLFINFKQVVDKYNIEQFQVSSYKEVKMLAVKYQQAWKFMKEQGFKIWTKKDDSLLKFYSS